MSLKLYRRHRKECEGGHAEDTRTGEFEEGRRGWKKCACLIHASGTLSGKFNRRQTGKSDWDEAAAVVAGWEAAQNWRGDTLLVSERMVADVSPRSDAPQRYAIDDVLKIYLLKQETARLKPSTLRKYKTLVRQIQEFARSRGYVFLDQITPADIDLFYASVRLGARTKSKWLSALRGFFRFCKNRRMIADTPVSADIKPPVGANRVANKVPFTDDELQGIISACERIGTVAWENGQGTGAWTGEDVKDFIWLSAYTGLRISDVAFFNMSRVRGNEVFLRAQKNGGDVFTYIPDWLLKRLTARAKRVGPQIFLIGKSTRLDTVTDLWRRKLNKVLDLAGKFEESATHHRIRHTFARILLERGVSVRDVADLLGDDEETVRQHYARWVPERQARLTSILQQAFADKPKLKIVTLPKASGS